MLYRRLALMTLCVGISTAAAQEHSQARPELRPFIGVFVPTGSHRDAFKSAPTVGMQGAFELSHYLHVLGSVGFTYGHAKFAGFSTDVTHIWQYDVGAEFNAYYEIDQDVFFRPFVGLGAGARTYDYDARGVGANSCTAGYGTLGSEFEAGPVALRFEARDYVTCFKSPLNGRKNTRNDLGLTVGFAYHLW